MRLSLQDASRARELAGAEGQALRAGAERFARAAVAGEMASVKPWAELLSAVRARGAVALAEVEAAAAAELELTPRKERKRVEGEWAERARRSRRRAATGALDLSLQLVSLWFADLIYLACGAEELVRNRDRLAELREDASPEPRGCGARSSWWRRRVSVSNSTSRRTWRAKRSPIGSSRHWGREPVVTRLLAGAGPR